MDSAVCGTVQSRAHWYTLVCHTAYSKNGSAFFFHFFYHCKQWMNAVWKIRFTLVVLDSVAKIHVAFAIFRSRSNSNASSTLYLRFDAILKCPRLIKNNNEIQNVHWISESKSNLSRWRLRADCRNSDLVKPNLHYAN